MNYLKLIVAMLAMLSVIMLARLGWNYDHSQDVNALMLNPMLAYPLATLCLIAPFAAESASR